ncbi:AraC family transcriptional regulator [Kineosporia babensis]|uniref:AraC family transcriptional regulator n=1 Tax=Kineosporia babensis TaxID=499548 RepID=A0A9X1NBH2_9ACTN|nr:AraC family transcriptional regulator [Kineosporia babensis]
MPSRTRELLQLLAVVNSRLHEDVRLTTLAKWAHRSRFDLHRRLRQLTGQTPKAYIMRVRLARAAGELAANDRRVSAIALDHGFGSHEVFTRAFTHHLGRSPQSYRARGLHVSGRQAADLNARAVNRAAPCVSLYRISLTERNTVVPSEISVIELPVTHALVMRRRITRDEIATALAETLPVVFGYAQQHGLAIAGPPFARYPEIGMGSLVIEGGITLAGPPSTQLPDEIDALVIPAGRAVTTIHRGPYDTLPESHQQIGKWMREEGLTADGAPWETYLTDPGDHPDPATWETQIIQPAR